MMIMIMHKEVRIPYPVSSKFSSLYLSSVVCLSIMQRNIILDVIYISKSTIDNQQIPPGIIALLFILFQKGKHQKGIKENLLRP